MSTSGSHTRSATNGVMAHTHDASVMTNGHSHDTRPAPPPPPPPASSSSAPAAPALSKLKQNKRQPHVASNEASKLVAQKIAQLELDQAGEKDQELEIEKEVRKANRELHSQTAKMDSIQKIEHLSRRCTDLLHDLKRHEREAQKSKKKTDQLQKERDQSRSELSKTISLKEKLEKLCRELQKENNKLKNENRTLKGNEVSNLNSWDLKYATLLQKLDDLQEEKDHPKKQVVDVELDELFRQRFKSLIEQYELRELHFHSLMRTKELEVQYNMARFERERKHAEAEAVQAQRLNEQVQGFSQREADLRNQLNVYVEKFKQEMEEAAMKIRKLEKENGNWRRKHDAMSDNVMNMVEERRDKNNLLDLTRRQLDKLKSIVILIQRHEGKMNPASPWITSFLSANGIGIIPRNASNLDDVQMAPSGSGGQSAQVAQIADVETVGEIPADDAGGDGAQGGGSQDAEASTANHSDGNAERDDQQKEEDSGDEEDGGDGDSSDEGDDRNANNAAGSSQSHQHVESTPRRPKPPTASPASQTASKSTRQKPKGPGAKEKGKGPSRPKTDPGVQ